MEHSKPLLVSLLAAVLLIAGCTQETDTLAEQPIEDPLPPSPLPIVEPPISPDYYLADRIFFDLDKAALREDAIATIEMQADWLMRHPDYSTLIEGHADERGTREYNLGLGCRRAVAMREALIASGIAPERVGTISYGKERPAVLGSNEDAWAQNRRSVLVVREKSPESTPPPLNCGER